MERKSLIISFILCLIVILYGAITFQPGLVFTLTYYVVVIGLILVILQKIVEHFQTSEEINKKMASNIESLTVSMSDIKEENREIKDITNKNERKN